MFSYYPYLLTNFPIQTCYIHSVRTIQHHLRLLSLNIRGHESNIDLIIDAVKTELDGISRNLGVGQIWKRLRRQYGLMVKR